MVVACAAPVCAAEPSSAAPASPSGWPHHWSQQEPLLERQHDRLEALLDSLIKQHRQPLPCEQLAPTDQAEQLACRRLLWDLRLHLRLEERWLEAAGSLCPGHRSGHQDAARAALAWLQGLQSWFAAHRRGPDAMAYTLARQRSGVQAAALT